MQAALRRVRAVLVRLADIDTAFLPPVPCPQHPTSGLARYLAQSPTTTTTNLVVHCEFVVVKKVRRGENTIDFLRVFATLKRRSFSSWHCDSSFGFVVSWLGVGVDAVWLLGGLRGVMGAPPLKQHSSSSYF